MSNLTNAIDRNESLQTPDLIQHTNQQPNTIPALDERDMVIDVFADAMPPAGVVATTSAADGGGGLHSNEVHVNLQLGGGTDTLRPGLLHLTTQRRQMRLFDLERPAAIHPSPSPYTLQNELNQHIESNQQHIGNEPIYLNSYSLSFQFNNNPHTNNIAAGAATAATAATADNADYDALFHSGRACNSDCINSNTNALLNATTTDNQKLNIEPMQLCSENECSQTAQLDSSYHQLLPQQVNQSAQLSDTANALTECWSQQAKQALQAIQSVHSIQSRRSVQSVQSAQQSPQQTTPQTIQLTTTQQSAQSTQQTIRQITQQTIQQSTQQATQQPTSMRAYQQGVPNTSGRDTGNHTPNTTRPSSASAASSSSSSSSIAGAHEVSSSGLPPIRHIDPNFLPNMLFYNRPFVIHLEGNNGAGKSRIMYYLRHGPLAQHIEFLDEPSHKWTNFNNHNLIADFQTNQPQAVAAYQQYSFNTLLENHLKPTTKPIKLMERSIHSCIRFARIHYHLGILDKVSLDILEHEYEMANNYLDVKPDLIISLSVPIDECKHNIKINTPANAIPIDVQYLEMIQYMHIEWMREEVAAKKKIYHIHQVFDLNKLENYIHRLICDLGRLQQRLPLTIPQPPIFLGTTSEPNTTVTTSPTTTEGPRGTLGTCGTLGTHGSNGSHGTEGSHG